LSNRRLRWIFFMVAILVGIAAGVFIGYQVAPVQYQDAVPQSLRFDYQTDYILMVAELYQDEGNAALAAARLIFMGVQNPSEMVVSAIIFAQENQYAPKDIQLMNDLARAIQDLNLDTQ